MQFREQCENLGFLPEALFNVNILLGWSPTGEEEIFNQTELIEIFDPERLSTSAAVFDQNKLKWMNGEYITKASKEKLIDITMPHLITSGEIGRASCRERVYIGGGDEGTEKNRPRQMTQRRED